MGKEIRRSRGILWLFLALCIFALMATFSETRVTAQSLIVVPPSGDMTGVTDANNIEAALLSVSPGGGVELLAGHFYISRSILVPGFSGIFKGAGKHDTIIEAVRMGPGVGEGFGLGDSPYGPIPYLFLFMEPGENLTIEDLTLQVLHPTPCDPYPSPLFPGPGRTALSNLLMSFGSNSHTVVMNIRMRGDTGELFGRNLGFAFMGNGMEGEGETTIESCDIENCVYGLDISRGVNYSAYIEDNYLFNLRTGIWIGFLQNSSIAIERNEIEGGIVQGIFLRGPSDASITGNTFKDFAGPGVPWRGPIVLWRDSHESFVAGNTFINIQGAGAAICVNTRENTLLFNDYRQSNLPGWMDTHPDGPGCVIFFGMTEGNVVAECLFPDGTTTSDQIRDLTDNPGTPEYDGRNMILTCSESLIFLINELLSEVERLVDEGKLNHGQGNSLVVKLEGALKQLENGKSQAACNKLGAFINEVNAHIRSGKLFLEDVALLIEGAGIIKTSLCG